MDAQFQFTHPRGVRFDPLVPITDDKGFNSRTREGCDQSKIKISPFQQFQFTHPRGVRLSRFDFEKLEDVSIHAPARGAIKIGSPGGEQDAFQFTHPRGVRYKPERPRIVHRSFNSRTREGCD